MRILEYQEKSEDFERKVIQEFQKHFPEGVKWYEFGNGKVKICVENEKLTLKKFLEVRKKVKQK